MPPHGTAQFKTVQEAINAAPQTTNSTNPCTIHIKPGVYKELIYVQREKRFVRLVGEDPEKTVLTYNLNANMPGANPSARVAWSRQLTEEEAKAISVGKVLGGSDGWNPKRASQ